MSINPFTTLPGATFEEINFLQHITTGLSETQMQNFLNIYYNRRKSPQDIMIFTLLGFVGIAGVQRFIVGQIFMGLVYFFTGGFCLIGTIVDLINHKSLTNEYNEKMAYESVSIAKMNP
jgi:TM2 domain-containing membrane protein YozV